MVDGIVIMRGMVARAKTHGLCAEVNDDSVDHCFLIEEVLIVVEWLRGRALGLYIP